MFYTYVLIFLLFSYLSSIFCRCQNAVKHFPVMRNEVAFKFGFCTFYTLEEFTEHFKQNPVIGGDSGM